MTPEEILRVVFGLLAVLGMIGAGAVIARKMGLLSASSPLARRRRLSLVETLALDARRKIAIVKCGEREYLIALGPQGETIIDAALPPCDESEDGATPVNPFAELRNAFARKNTQDAA